MKLSTILIAIAILISCAMAGHLRNLSGGDSNCAVRALNRCLICRERYVVSR